MITVLTRSMWATDWSDIPLGDGLNSHGWTRGGAETGGGGGTNYANASYVSTTISGGSISDRGIVVDQSNDAEYRHARWTLLGAIGSFEFLALVRLLDAPDTVGGGGFCWVEGSGSDADGYDWVFDADASGSGSGNDSVHVSQFSNGFFDAVVGSAEHRITLDTTNRFWMRGRKNGTTYSIKCWQFGTAEPSYVSDTDSTYTSNSFFGIQTVQNNRFRVDWLSVVPSSGKTAPFPQG